jgi:oxygen-independent coproporphyrinogen-3 oxidase
MPDAYMADRIQYRVGQERIEPEAQAFEFMMNALRLKDGVEETLFEDRTELSLSDISATLGKLRSEGLMLPERIQLTERGFMFLNSVLERFL